SGGDFVDGRHVVHGVRSFPTRRSSDLVHHGHGHRVGAVVVIGVALVGQRALGRRAEEGRASVAPVNADRPRIVVDTDVAETADGEAGAAAFGGVLIGGRGHAGRHVVDHHVGVVGGGAVVLVEDAALDRVGAVVGERAAGGAAGAGGGVGGGQAGDQPVAGEAVVEGRGGVGA